MSIELVMPSNRLIPCGPLLLQLSIIPSISVFSNMSVLSHISYVVPYLIHASLPDKVLFIVLSKVRPQRLVQTEGPKRVAA